MAYKCPRCGEPVQRGDSVGATVAAGAIGAIFYAAFGAFRCKKCGKIPQGEFAPEDRAKMTAGAVFLVIVALALIGFLIWLLSILASIA